MPEEKHFMIGLTMAGAVSAGAYTAGVLDVLFRAMDAHNAAVDNPDVDENERPRHKVAIKVMSGASAGSVCAGLAVASLIDAQAPGKPHLARPRSITVDRRDDTDTAIPEGGLTYQVSLNPMHAGWVELLDLWHSQDSNLSGKGLLGQSDLDMDPTVYSLLDGGHLTEATGEALKKITWSDGADSVGAPYDFISSDLDLFLTTTDLMGVPYEVSFGGRDGQVHAMKQHSTVRHFRVKKLGTHEFTSPWLEFWGDEGITLELPQGGGQIPFQPLDSGDPWARMTVSCIASGAFPVGLPSVLIEATASEFGTLAGNAACGGAMPIEIEMTPEKKAKLPRPEFSGLEHDAPVNYVAADGGAINNEPFGYARYALRQISSDPKKLAPNPRKPEEADRAVLMIDPFPEGPTFEPIKLEGARKERAILKSLARLVPTMIDQARFKPSELINAADENVRSRFLLSPVRDASDGKIKYGAQAIACGSLGGFGGFIDQRFRMHDFLLGQHNCKKFLQEKFTLNIKNQTLGFYDVNGEPIEGGQAAEHARVQAGNECQIIFTNMPAPLLGDNEQLGQSIDELALPEMGWPQANNTRLLGLLKKAQQRFKRVGSELISRGKLPWYLRMTLGAIWGGTPLGGGVEESLGDTITVSVLSELVRRRQVHGIPEMVEWEQYAFLELLGRKRKAVDAAGLLEGLTARRKTLIGPDGQIDWQVPSLSTLQDKLERWAKAELIHRRKPLLADARYRHVAFAPGRWGVLSGWII